MNLNKRVNQITGQVLDEVVPETWTALGYDKVKEIQNRTVELMILEFCDVIKDTANELNEFYTKQGDTEEQVLTRVNGALVVLGHVRARFMDNT